MSDRERLEAMARANEQKRQADELTRRQLEAGMAQQKAQRKASDEAESEAIFQYCKKEFQGFKLIPTGHVVQVDKAPASKIHGIKNDGHEYVCLSISHWGEETNDFEGVIPVIMARFIRGEYQVSDYEGRMKTLKSFDELKEQLLQQLANMNRDAVKKLFALVRRQLSRR